MKRIQKILHKKWRLVIFFVAVMIVTTMIGAVAVRALMKDEDTVHIKNSDVEMSTLIIGTHLISLGAITDEVYDIAVKTQSQSNQSSIYYKSELADGAWYEISSAVGLDDIMDTGTKVSEKVIEGLNVRYYTKSDGITYDLKTGGTVCIFDLNDPYKIAGNTDLEAIQVQKDALDGKETKNDSDKYYENLLNEFEKTDLSSEATAGYDKNIKEIQKYYEETASSNPDNREVLMGVMKKLDSTRRAEAYEKLSENVLDDLLTKANLTNASDDSLTLNSEIVSAIGTALENVEKQRTQYESEKVSEGDSVLSKTENKLINEISQNATLGNDIALQNNINKLTAFYNIENGVKGNTQQEDELIQNELYPSAMDNLNMLLSAGVNEEYKEKEAQGASKTALSQVLTAQKNDINQALSQLQFLVDAKASRMTSDAAKEYLLQQTEKVTEMLSKIPDDALKPYAQEALNDYYMEIYDRYLDYSSGGSNEMDSLLAKKKELQQEKLKALDDNELAQAAMLDKQLEEINNQISAKENELNAIIASDTTTQTQKAEAAAQLGSGNASDIVKSLKEQTLSDIQNGQYSELDSDINAIIALVEVSPVAVQSALKEIYQQLATKLFLTDANSTDVKKLLSDAMEKIEALTAENADLFSGNNLSQETVFQIVKEVEGNDFILLSSEAQVVITAVVNEYASYLNSSSLQETAVTMMSMMYSNNNPYIFEKLKNVTQDYVSIKAVSMCTDFRYVYSDNEREATLQRGAEYYKYNAFSTLVERQDNSNGEMSGAAKLQGSLYIPAEYAEATFSCTTNIIPGSDYGLVYSYKMYEQYGESFYSELVDKSS